MSLPGPELEVVVAADEAWGIGRRGDLPWRIPEDMKHFRRLTQTVPRDSALRNLVLIGRRTWQSIPSRFRPLPGRHNLVLSRRGLELPVGVEQAADFPTALAALAARRDLHRIFVIGGGEVYRAAFEQASCRTLHLTQVAGGFDCDAQLPDPTAAGFQLEETEDWRSSGDLRFRFTRWRRW